MRPLSLALLILGVSIIPARATPFSHARLDSLLHRHVDPLGRVDYAALTAAPQTLQVYMDSLATVSPRTAPDRFPDDQYELAYWINAYNASVISGVVSAYPVSSVRDIGLLNGFFRRKKFTIGGEELTLDRIENEIIRPLYRDPRIHFVVNCGAVSCPELENRAFTGDSLDSRLENALKRFANNPKHVRLDRRRQELHLSKILEWYGQDFVDWFPRERRPQDRPPTLIDYLLPYLPETDADFIRSHPQLTLRFEEYDWALNDQRSEREQKK